MGRLENDGDSFVYRQEDGEITAWLADDEEKMVLAHEGDRQYKRVFYALVLSGLIYLAVVFFF
jgi:hypothetical protein